MSRLLMLALFSVTISLAACNREANVTGELPVDIKFLSASDMFGRDSGVPSCSLQAYDAETGVIHIRVRVGGDVSAGFEITRISDRITKPIAFRLTGVPDEYGCMGWPLNLKLKEKRYPLVGGFLGKADETLFRVERDDKAVLIVFTEKGQALLEPGAQIGFSVDHAW